MTKMSMGWFVLCNSLLSFWVEIQYCILDGCFHVQARVEHGVNL
jgi:hypothetical protein